MGKGNKTMDKWTELRTAYKLAKLGTLSATADALGVHRSTVMRHIDVLEEHLQVKLFQRNDRGYIATEAGIELMRIGEVTDDQFSQLQARLAHQEQDLSGTISITCASEMTRLLMPAIREYQHNYPLMCVDIIGDLRNFNLEYGEADLAIRAGPKPTTLDNVVIPLLNVDVVMCVHQSYIEQHGLPTKDNLLEHRFVTLHERVEHLPWDNWFHQNIPAQNIAIKGTNYQVLNDVILQGGGIGFLARDSVELNPEMQIIEVGQSWQVALWTLVHRDMIHLPKIRKFLDILQAQQHWDFTIN